MNSTCWSPAWRRLSTSRRDRQPSQEQAAFQRRRAAFLGFRYRTPARRASSSSVADVVPDRIRWAVETLAVEPDDRLLEIGGGPGVAASLVCERLDRGNLLLIDRSATAIERTRRRNPEHVTSGRLDL